MGVDSDILFAESCIHLKLLHHHVEAGEVGVQVLVLSFHLGEVLFHQRLHPGQNRHVFSVILGVKAFTLSPFKDALDLGLGQLL